MELYLKAIILGIVEGLTEFLPVSSTAHLSIASKLLGFTPDWLESFEVIIQLGAILAVFSVYSKRFVSIISLKNNEGLNGTRGMSALALVSLPTLTVGFLLRHQLKPLFSNSYSIAAALIVGGLLLLITDRLYNKAPEKKIEELPLSLFLLMGIFQVFSLWIGMSRSGSLLIGGALLGLRRNVATEIAFLGSFPVIGIATAYEIIKTFKEKGLAESPEMWKSTAIAFIISFVVGSFAIKGFIKYVANNNLGVFGYYRILVGISVLLWFQAIFG